MPKAVQVTMDLQIPGARLDRTLPGTASALLTLNLLGQVAHLYWQVPADTGWVR